MSARHLALALLAAVATITACNPDASQPSSVVSAATSPDATIVITTPAAPQPQVVAVAPIELPSLALRPSTGIEALPAAPTAAAPPPTTVVAPPPTTTGQPPSGIDGTPTTQPSSTSDP